MTLLSTLQLAKNALFASQLGIQVSANNISNADTPGYVRERVVQSPAATQQIGRIVTGTGVQVDGVVRQVDKFLQERLRSAISDLASGEARQQAYVQLETVVGELNDSDLSTAITEFFSSLQDVLNQPEIAAGRNLAVLRGDALGEQIQHLDDRVRGLRTSINDQILSSVEEVNKSVQEIAKLNLQIMQVEQGGAITSDAVGLRDRRDEVLKNLAQMVNIRVDEQQSGAVNVFVGGDYLVFDGTTQTIRVSSRADHDLTIADLHLSNSDSQLNATSGKLAGLVGVRDDVLAGFLDDLDAFTKTLIFEFNRIHAGGQGLTGFQQMVSAFAVTDSTKPLDDAGLPFLPEHGSFDVLVTNRATGITATHGVRVGLSGFDDDTTPQDLVAQLDGIDGLSAAIQYDGRLQLQTDSNDLEFAFAHDTSGVVAALGMNTFFSGEGAQDIGINQAVVSDPSKLAFSQNGVGHDTHQGEQLANMATTSLASRAGASLAQVYEQWIGQTAQESALATAVADGFRAFKDTLEGDHLALSGVSLDEEAVNMMTYQRTFQAAAKVISTVNELLDVLVNL